MPIAMVVVPTVDSVSRVIVAVVIAEAVVPIRGPDPQVEVDAAAADHTIGCVQVIRMPRLRGKMNGGEQRASIGQSVVPVSRHEDAAARSPNVAIRNPHPTGVVRRPEPRPPTIFASLIQPAAGHPKIDVRRRRAGRTVFEALWGRHEIAQFVGIVPNPESERPLVAPFNVSPVTRHPAPPSRRYPPDTTDPDEVVALDFKQPIPLDPNHIAGRLDLRRKFTDRLRRLEGNHWSGRWIKGDRFRIRLVNRPPGQHLKTVNAGHSWSRFLGYSGGDKKDRNEQKKLALVSVQPGRPYLR